MIPYGLGIARASTRHSYYLDVSNQQGWDIATALRGPDDKSVVALHIKRVTTAVLRYLIYPSMPGLTCTPQQGLQDLLCMTARHKKWLDRNHHFIFHWRHAMYRVEGGMDYLIEFQKWRDGR